MRIACPYCGERDVAEFVTIGGVAGPRPDPAAADAFAAYVDHVHLRDNPAGPNPEHWYHAYGCRRWLLVTRDTRSHAILSTALVAP